MSALFAVFLPVLMFAVLSVPPALALRMLLVRLRWARPQNRMIIGMLCAVALLMLVFNVLVALGASAGLKAVLPPFVADHPGTTALLFSWTAFGVCLFLALIAPHRGHASHI